MQFAQQKRSSQLQEVDVNKGVTCFNFDEVKTKQKAMEKTDQAILVIDSSKINQVQKSLY